MGKKEQTTVNLNEKAEHSSPSLTARTYTRTDTMLAPAVERLPVDEWLQCQ